MKGWRTIAFNVISFAVTFGGVALQYVGTIGLSDKQTAITMIAINGIVIAGNLYLRTITTSPVGQAL
jgi:hypothetical protein